MKGDKKMWKCPKCDKVYKHNGYWVKRHMVEKCHVMHLKPVKLLESYDISLTNIVERLNKIESTIKNLSFKTTKFVDNPIERIKHEEQAKILDPLLSEYRKAFQECLSELKEVLEIRKKRIEVSQLELIRD